MPDYELPIRTLTHVRGIDSEGRVGRSPLSQLFAASGRPASRKVRVFGDSNVSRGILNSGSNVQRHARGIEAWPKVLTNQAFDCSILDNYGLGGAVAADTLATMRAVLPSVQRGVSIVNIGTNDVDLTPITTTYPAIVQLCADLGEILIFINGLPRGGSDALVTTQLNYFRKRIAYLNSISNTPGVYVADAFSTLVDPALATGVPLAGMFDPEGASRGLHMYDIAAYTAFSGNLTSILNNLFPPRNLLPTDAGGIYDATENSLGWLHANPMMTGVGGTLGSNGGGTFSGTVCDSWTAALANATGLTVTMAGNITLNGKVFQRAVISGTPSSANCSLKLTISASMSSLLAANDTLEAVGEWAVAAGQTGISAIQLEAVSSLNRRDMAQASVIAVYPTAALDNVQRIDPWVVPASDLGFLKHQWVVYFLQSVAVSATVYFRATGVHKVV